MLQTITAAGVLMEFRGELLTLQKKTYVDNGRTALVLVDELGFLYMTCSVNIPSYPVQADQVLIKNWSENSGILEALERVGVIRDLHVEVPTGYTFANLCQLLI